jgi:hypothetical protein
MMLLFKLFACSKRFSSKIRFEFTEPNLARLEHQLEPAAQNKRH